MAITPEQFEQLKKAVFYAQQDPAGAATVIAKLIDPTFGESDEGDEG